MACAVVQNSCAGGRGLGLRGAVRTTPIESVAMGIALAGGVVASGDGVRIVHGPAMSVRRITDRMAVLRHLGNDRRVGLLAEVGPKWSIGETRTGAGDDQRATELARYVDVFVVGPIFLGAVAA